MEYKILTDGDKKLRQISKEINEKEIKSKDFQIFCDDLKKCMDKNKGIGIASPQIGKNIRLILINAKDGPIYMINPKITKKSLIKEWGEEGCLSVPETFGNVKRCKKIKCVYTDKNNKKQILDASGLMARVVQHEIDHLDGVLFIDKAKKIKKEES